MHFNHVGITNKSEEDALSFYRDFLGFEITREYTVPEEISYQIFNISQDIKAMIFEKNDIRIELFVYPGSERPPRDMRHMALFVDDLNKFLDKARQSGVEHITGKTKDKTVHFIKDFSGNLIEIKQKQ